MTTPRQLLLGCGDIQRDGWEHLDIRDLPHVDHLMSAVDLSAFNDHTFTVIEAVDLIEHISWRDIPKALTEWRRVLTPGGKVIIETPDAVEAALILDGRPPGPRWEGESDWGMFCRTLFGHQDHAGNYHASYFTPKWLTELLTAAGYGKVTIIRSDERRFRLEAFR